MAGTGRAAETCFPISASMEDKLEQYVSITSSHNAVDGRDPCSGLAPVWGGAAKRISKGLRLARALRLILMYIRTMGSAFGNGRAVSLQHFASLFFSVPFSLSTAPPLAG